MKEHNKKVNNKAEDRNSKKIVAAVGALLALITVVTVFLFAKEPLFLALTRKAVLEEKFETAETLVKMCDSDESDVLKKYIGLRMEINSDYVQLRTEFDRQKIEKWQKTAAELKESEEIDNEELEAEINLLSERLDGICRTLREYDELKPETMELFEVFNEINRLYTKDETGLNPVFTIEQELAAIDNWEEIARKLDKFTMDAVNGEKMYLLAFFVKEAQGEASDLRESVNGFVQQGYETDAQIRVTGEKNRTFPSIQNSNGVFVNFQQKDTYEECMYQGMCVALVDSLGEFYVS